MRSSLRRSEMPWERDEYSAKELGLLAQRLDSAMAEVESAPQKRSPGRRWLVAGPIAAATAVILLLAVGALRGDPTGALSLDEAVAAVAKAAFESPLDQPGRTVYAHSRFTGTDNGWSQGIGS